MNPVAPNKPYLENIQDFRLFQFTDNNGLLRQARGYAGFAWQGFFNTLYGSPQVLAPTIDPYLDLPTVQQVPNDVGGAWQSFVLHAANIGNSAPLSPPVYGPDLAFKGLWTLGNTARSLQPADEFSPCGNVPASTCVAYFQGPIKLGYLYGYGSDDAQGALPQSLNVNSLGNCKIEFVGNLPYSAGFTNKDSAIVENSIAARVPSESYIFLDGSRVIRVKLQTWFAVLSDSSYQNQWAAVETYMYAQNLEFWDNPYVAGPDPQAPFYQAGQKWYSVNPQGQIVWNRTLQHAGGQSFWLMKWFEENPTYNPVNLSMVVKTWYVLPQNPDGTQPDDPYPDPWAIGIDEYLQGDFGVRPPDDCLMVSGSTVTTCFAGGDEIFNVDPTYSNVPGFTWSTSRDQSQILWVHCAYYYNNVLVGQNTWKNIVAGSGYFPSLWFFNPPPTVEGVTLQYPTCTANANIYPWGSTGEDTYPFATMNLTSRNGKTMTWTAVFPTNMGANATIDFGDGSSPVSVAALASISHTYSTSGSYTVAITFDGRVSRTVFQTG